MKFDRRSWGLTFMGLLALIIGFVPLPSAVIPPTDRTIRIDASTYSYSPSTLTINPGDRVTLELVSSDVMHGLYIDGYNLNLTAAPGQTSRLTFIADHPGAFRFRCSVTCGPMHPFMIGQLKVGTNWLWVRAVGLVVLAALAGIILSRP